MTAIPSTAHKQGRVQALKKYESARVGERTSAEAAFSEDINRFARRYDSKRNLELLRRHRAGDRSVEEQLVRENMPLVLRIAKQHTRPGLEHIDLIQAGALGLLKSIRAFDEQVSADFGKFAGYGVLTAIRGAKARLCGNRVPKKVYKLWWQIQAVEKEYYRTHNDQPTTVEIAERVGISVLEVLRTVEAMKGPKSLDDPVGDREGRTVGDFVGDNSRMDPLDATIASDELDQAVQLLIRVFSALRKRNAWHFETMRLYFGLDQGMEQRTLDDTGKLCGVTRERIRQIREKVKAWARSAYHVQDLEQMCAQIPVLAELVGNENALEQVALL